MQSFKALVGKNGDVQQALDRLAQLTRQEHQLVSATIRTVTNNILSELCELTVGVYHSRLVHMNDLTNN